MTTCDERRDRPESWAVWLTGLPASGKSSIAGELARRLRHRGEVVEVLESDVLRQRLTPTPTYSDAERDLFYGAVAWMGVLLSRHGVGVIFDATANRRRYRDAARRQITQFMEVWVRCPIELCRQRDRKGIYAAAEKGQADTVPGATVAYEVNEAAELVVDADRVSPGEAAERIVEEMGRRGWLGRPASAGDRAAKLSGRARR